MKVKMTDYYFWNDLFSIRNKNSDNLFNIGKDEENHCQ